MSKIEKSQFVGRGLVVIHDPAARESVTAMLKAANVEPIILQPPETADFSGDRFCVRTVNTIVASRIAPILRQIRQLKPHKRSPNFAIVEVSTPNVDAAVALAIAYVSRIKCLPIAYYRCIKELAESRLALQEEGRQIDREKIRKRDLRQVVALTWSDMGWELTHKVGFFYGLTALSALDDGSLEAIKTWVQKQISTEEPKKKKKG